MKNLLEKMKQFKEKENKQFEEALQLLEESVQVLDTGKASLEASVELYQQGTELALFCQQKLEEAEAQIKKYHPQKDAEEDFGV